VVDPEPEVAEAVAVDEVMVAEAVTDAEVEAEAVTEATAEVGAAVPQASEGPDPEEVYE